MTRIPVGSTVAVSASKVLVNGAALDIPAGKSATGVVSSSPLARFRGCFQGQVAGVGSVRMGIWRVIRPGTMKATLDAPEVVRAVGISSGDILTLLPMCTITAGGTITRGG